MSKKKKNKNAEPIQDVNEPSDWKDIEILIKECFSQLPETTDIIYDDEESSDVDYGE